MRIVGDDSETCDYGSLLRMIRSVAYRLTEEGIEFGDRVALIGENHPCWAVAYLGTLYRGAVCVPIDPHGEIETITNFLENSETKLAFLSPDMTDKFSQIEEKLGRHIPSVVWRMENSSNGFQRFEEWTATAFPDAFATASPPAKPDDTALLMYTSGTTGTPKGVPLSHGNIVAELDGINRVLQFGPDEKILSLLPLFHAYLQIVNLWVAPTCGAEVGYLKELTPEELGRSMREFKPTILTTVPRLWYLFHKKIFDAVLEKPKALRTLFRTMLAINGFTRGKLGINLGRKMFTPVHESFGGNLRFAVTAGSRFDESVAIDFDRLGFTIIQGYGLTETSGAVTATYLDDNRVGSVGKAFFNSAVKLDEPDAAGVGEVLLKGEVVFHGYYRNPTATAEVFTEDGWFRSGDLGRFDEDGHLYIVGRRKDVIVLPNGKNVHPEDLEIHYLKSPYVSELAVLGVEDKSFGRSGAEKLVAVVVPDFEFLKNEKIANSQAVIKFDLDTLGRDLPEYQRVREYIVRAEPLPRTATRKIKRFQLKKDLESGLISTGETAPAKTWTLTESNRELMNSAPGSVVSEIVTRALREPVELHPDMNLEIDLRLDSLSRAELFAALENALGAEFEAEEAAQALTVSDAVALAERHGAGDASREISTDLNWKKIIATTDDPIPELQLVLRDRPAFLLFAFVVYKCFNLFCRGFMRLEVEGREHLLELKKPFLICPNHQSFLDPFVLCSTYDLDRFKNTFHVGASEFFQSRFMKWVAKMLQTVPVDPDTQLMKAMRAGATGLKHGRILNIYPEGERGFDGDLHEFKKGAAILSTELDLPILPVAIEGLQNVWARNSMKIRPAKVRIRFGEPIRPKEIITESMSPDEKYEIVISELRRRIEVMLTEMRDR